MLAHTTDAAADGFKDCDQFFPQARCLSLRLALRLC
jgi:hypothetical protein